MRAAAAALLAALCCALPARAGEVQRARWLMGTLWTAAAPAAAADSARTGGALDAALDEVATLEALLSNWSATSALCRLNAAGRGEGLPEPLVAVIDSAVALAAFTGGAFEPTVEPLTRAWDLRGAGRVPDARELASARAAVGWRRLSLDARAARVALGGAQLDLGGIAKGFALDRAAAALLAAGVREASLDAGGQRLAIGRAERVWIAGPSGRDEPAVSVALEGGSLSTSAQSERFVRAGGERRGHVLDPRTGQPLATRASVSVHAASATRADALSTALLVMGRERAEAFAAAHPELGVVWLEPARNGVRAWAWNIALTGMAAGVTREPASVPPLPAASGAPSPRQPADPTRP